MSCSISSRKFITALRYNTFSIKALRKVSCQSLAWKFCSLFSVLCNVSQGLECYLLTVKRRNNLRKSNDPFDRGQNITSIVKALQRASNRAPFVKPFLHLLQSYMERLRGRKVASQAELQTSYKFAMSQGNKLAMAWIGQNRRVSGMLPTSCLRCFHKLITADLGRG